MADGTKPPVSSGLLRTAYTDRVQASIAVRSPFQSGGLAAEEERVIGRQPDLSIRFLLFALSLRGPLNVACRSMCECSLPESSAPSLPPRNGCVLMAQDAQDVPRKIAALEQQAQKDPQEQKTRWRFRTA